jgi:nucleoid DNA-binding protein
VNNSDLIEKLRRLYPNLNKLLLQDMICSIWEYLSLSLQKNNRIELRTFGSFFITVRNHNLANDNSNKKLIKVIHFRSSKKSKQILNDYRFD